MKKREAEFTTRLKKWLTSQSNMEFSTCVCEVKVTTGTSIPFNAVQDHQLQGLEHAKHDKFGYKIPDTGYQNPFDLIVVDKVPAFVVLAFFLGRGKWKFWFVDVDGFVELRQSSQRKSINMDMLAHAEKIPTLGFYVEGFEL